MENIEKKIRKIKFNHFTKKSEEFLLKDEVATSNVYDNSDDKSGKETLLDAYLDRRLKEEFNYWKIFLSQGISVVTQRAMWKAYVMFVNEEKIKPVRSLEKKNLPLLSTVLLLMQMKDKFESVHRLEQDIYKLKEMNFKVLKMLEDTEAIEKTVRYEKNRFSFDIKNNVTVTFKKLTANFIQSTDNCFLMNIPETFLMRLTNQDRSEIRQAVWENKDNIIIFDENIKVRFSLCEYTIHDDAKIAVKYALKSLLGTREVLPEIGSFLANLIDTWINFTSAEEKEKHKTIRIYFTLIVAFDRFGSNDTIVMMKILVRVSLESKNREVMIPALNRILLSVTGQAIDEKMIKFEEEPVLNLKDLI